MLQCLRFRYAVRTTSYHNRQFCLVVKLDAARINRDVIVRPGNAADRFAEHHGMRGDRNIRLFRVECVVQTEGHELTGPGDRGPKPRSALHQRELLGVEFPQAREPLWRHNIGSDVPNDSGERADAPLLVEQSRLFLARRAKAKQFHAAVSLRCA